MTIYESKILTVVVCSNSLDKIKKYSVPSLTKIDFLCEMLIIVDKSVSNVNSDSLIELKTPANITTIFSPLTGLSNLRNYALNYCHTKFILFIDDDITIEPKHIKIITGLLNDGIDIVGLKLCPPSQKYIQRWYLTSNQYHYIGIHSTLNNNSIWGACMAFNIFAIKKSNLKFCSYLGRQHKRFLSGEDTTFINELKEQGSKFKLAQNFVVHHIDKYRLNFSVLVNRVFWQGITEVVRCNTKTAIQKELKRNFQIVTIKTVIVGTIWFSVFLCGLFYGFFYKNSNKSLSR